MNERKYYVVTETIGYRYNNQEVFPVGSIVELQYVPEFVHLIRVDTPHSPDREYESYCMLYNVEYAGVDEVFPWSGKLEPINRNTVLNLLKKKGCNNGEI